MIHLAVRIRFDSAYNVIQPTFVLATRSGRKICPINATNVSVSDSFNSHFELEFQVNINENGAQFLFWDEIADFKLVWCREWDVWFEIYVEVQDSDNTVKNVRCVSIGEAELSQVNLYNIEINTEGDISRDDYSPTVLYNNINHGASLLHRIMDKVPHYSIKHADSSIANIQRTFSFNDTSLYDAFQSISEEIDCIFIIDSGTSDDGSIKRSISVFDLEDYCVDCGHRGRFYGKCPKCGSTNVLTGYGEDTSIFVSTENLADNITLKTNIDSVKNCFRLSAGDDLMTAAIRSCNPTGSQYIWYISDEIKKDMSGELVAKLKEYDSTYKYYYNDYSPTIPDNTRQSYNQIVGKYTAYSSDIGAIPDRIVGYPAVMNVYYDIIDMRLLLSDSLMPSPRLSGTSAASQVALITPNAIPSVAVKNLSVSSQSTISNAVLSMVKTIIDHRYQVKVKNGTLNGNAWTGSFTVTSYSDDKDTADSQIVTFALTNNYELYVKQRLEKSLKSSQTNSDSPTDIVSLFKTQLSLFEIELNKYCMSSLNSFCDACQSCLDIMVEQGLADKETWSSQNPDLYTTLYLDYYNKLLSIRKEIATRSTEISIVDDARSKIESEKSKIQDSLNMERCLGTDLWLEFISYRREDTYSNDNYISDGLNNSELFSRAVEFIEVAQKEIYKSSTLQHSLSASLKNLLVMREFEPIIDKFSVGNWIRIKINNEIYRLRMISYSIDFDSLDDISVEFSDVSKYADGVSDSESIFKQASSMASSYDAVTRQAGQGNKSKKLLQNWVENGLDLTNMKIVSSADNQDVMWDSHGVLCREYIPETSSYSDKQLKIINRGLYVTNNNWLTSRAGIGDFDPDAEGRSACILLRINPFDPNAEGRSEFMCFAVPTQYRKYFLFSSCISAQNVVSCRQRSIRKKDSCSP